VRHHWMGGGEMEGGAGRGGGRPAGGGLGGWAGDSGPHCLGCRSAGGGQTMHSDASYSILILFFFSLMLFSFQLFYIREFLFFSLSLFLSLLCCF
jgi:hypothetical protein